VCRNLSQLPNFAYSVALATFHLSLASPELRNGPHETTKDSDVHTRMKHLTLNNDRSFAQPKFPAV
jgi:hypothetical protein